MNVLRRGVVWGAAAFLVSAPLAGFTILYLPEGGQGLAFQTAAAGSLSLWAPVWVGIAVALAGLATALPWEMFGRLLAAAGRALSRPSVVRGGYVLGAIAVLGFPFLPTDVQRDLAGWETGLFGVPLQPLGWLTLDTLTNLWLYVILALGLNLIVGQCGVLVLGYGAFYGAGAYAMALLAAGLPVMEDGFQVFRGFLPYWQAVGAGCVLGAAFAALAGLLVGIPALRLRGDYLAIVTLGFGEAFVLVAKNWSDVTGGTNGVNITPAMLKPLKGTWAYPNAVWHYYLALAAAAAAVLFHARLADTRIGRAWRAIREDETAARAMGIDAFRLKLQAFAIAAGWAGLAGALFAARIRFVTPESFTFLESVTILVMVVLGGMRGVSGAVLGAFWVTVLLEFLRNAGTWRMLVFGALLVAVMVGRARRAAAAGGGAR